MKSSKKLTKNKIQKIILESGFRCKFHDLNILNLHFFNIPLVHNELEGIDQ